MPTTTMLYTVLPASGGWVAGAEVAIGAEIALTEAEARYELDLGAIAPTGREPPQPPLPPALLAGDLIETRRGAAERPVVVTSLEQFLIRDGGALAAYLDAYAADLAVRLTAQGSTLDGLRQQLLGGADAQHDSFGKVAGLLAELRAALDAVTSAIAPKTF